MRDFQNKRLSTPYPSVVIWVAIVNSRWVICSPSSTNYFASASPSDLKVLLERSSIIRVKSVHHHVVKKAELGVDAARFNRIVDCHLCECFHWQLELIFSMVYYSHFCTVPWLHRHRLHGVGTRHFNNSQSLSIRKFGNHFMWSIICARNLLRCSTVCYFLPFSTGSNRFSPMLWSRWASSCLSTA